MVTNMKDIQNTNRSKIFKLIYNNDGVSKQYIANTLNISLPTISSHLRWLKDEGLIIDNESMTSKIGRKAKSIQINSNFFISIGIEIKLNCIILTILNLKNEILKNEVLNKEYIVSPDYFDEIINMAFKFQEESGFEDRKLVGIGISLPAIVNSELNKVISSYILNINNQELSPIFMKYDIPIMLFNCPKVAAKAEFNLMDSNNLHSFVYLWLSTNIGAAVIYKNQDFYGTNFKEGEIAHLPIIPEGKLHYCGKKGCFGAYCEIPVLIENESLDSFFKKLESNYNYQEKWNEYLKYLAMGINALHLMYDLDIILGGDLVDYIGKYFDSLKEYLRNMDPFGYQDNYFHLGKISKYAPSIGAAQQIISSYLDNINKNMGK